MALLKSFVQKVRNSPDLDVYKEFEESSTVASMLNVLDNTGQGLIHYATRFCKLETLKLLLKLGANVNLRTVPEGSTIFHICATMKFRENLEITNLADWEQFVNDFVATVIDAKGDPLKRDTVGSNCAHIAVREDNFQFLQAILNLLNYRQRLLTFANCNGLTCLHIAAQMQNFRLCQLLLKYNSALENLVNLKDQQGQLPLHIAITTGNYEIVKLFLDNKSDVNHPNSTGETPLHLSCQSSNCTANIISTLISSGAICNAVNHAGDTPLHYACSNHNFAESIFSLLPIQPSGHMAMRHPNRKGLTPIMIAASLGRLGLVRILISNGSSTYDMDDRHNSIVYLSAANNRWKTLATLLDIYDLQDLVNVPNVDGSTPLHIASANGYEECVKLLIRDGADPQLKNKWGQTAIMLASHNRHPIVTEILLDSLHTFKKMKCGKTVVEDNLINLAERLKSACVTGCGEYVRTHLKEFGNNKFNSAQSGQQSCLQIAIDSANVDVVEAIVESDWWKESLRSCVGTHKLPKTPLRSLIEKYPHIALRVFDKCVKIHTDTNQLIFRFEFLEDTFAICRKPIDSTKVVTNDINEMSTTNDAAINAECPFSYENPFDSKGNLNDLAIPYSSDSNELIDNHPITLMVRLGRIELLDHPLVKIFLYQKWYNYGRLWFLFLLFTYINFLFFLSGYLLATPAPYMFAKTNETNSTSPNNLNLTNSSSNQNLSEPECPPFTQHPFAIVAKSVIYVQTPLLLVKEFGELLQRRRRYFSLENLLELSLYSFSLVFVLDLSKCASLTGIRTDVQYQLGCVAVFLAWVNLGLFLRKFRHVGIQIIVFTRVLSTFINYATACAIFIIAFAFVFFGLLQNQPAYATPYLALVKTATLVISDFEIFDKILNVNKREDGGVVQYSHLTVVFFLLFLGLIVIIMMNMLVGLAVVDIKEVLQQATLRKLAMRAEMIMDMETRMQNSKFLRSIMVRRGWIKRKLIVSLTDTNKNRLWSKLGDKWKFLKIFSFFRHRKNRMFMAAIAVAERNRIAPVLNSLEKEKNSKSADMKQLQMLKTTEELKLSQNELIERVSLQCQAMEQLKLMLIDRK